MTNEEKAKLVTEFRCSLFDDLPIKLAEVFEPYKIHYKTKASPHISVWARFSKTVRQTLGMRLKLERED